MHTNMQKRIFLKLEKIGYLDYFEIELRPGLNLISAPNASGKTSFIRGLASMFSDKIPPSHILSLDAAYGKISVEYENILYEKHFRRTPTGQVGSYGKMLPFTDSRAFDSCVALAETGVIHRITGGEGVFRKYLEILSHGNYFSKIIYLAQELTNQLSRKLTGTAFKKFESLPKLLTELTDMHIRRDLLKDQINDLENKHNKEIFNFSEKMEKESAFVSTEQNTLSDLEKTLTAEKNREDELLKLLEIADKSTRIANQLKMDIESSRQRQEEKQEEISKQELALKALRSNLEDIKNELNQMKSKKIKGLDESELEIERLNKAIILKEDDIQKAEKFPLDDPEYKEQLVVEVRAEITRQIDWLNMAIEYFQEKYIRLMAIARVRFNNNATRAFEELGLKGFEKVFLDQDFSIHIIRTKGIRQPVETLSASEKLTVGLVLMLAGKNSFLPDFPFFIIDELTLSYDPERFREIVNLIKRSVSYVLITSLTTSDTGKPKIIYNT